MLNVKQPPPFQVVNIPREAFLPAYRDLRYSTAIIELLYGGRDSGKSYFIASWLLTRCMAEKYFRCILVRKVKDTIKESQWQMLKDIAQAWGVDHLFQFIANPLEIRCINGNKFICRGMDEPGKVKSTANPSDMWGEEMNQCDMDDFVVLMTSLRSNKGNPKVWLSFNPETEGDYQEHWIYKTFYKDAADPYSNFSSDWSMDFTDEKTGAVKRHTFSYNSTWTTYKDNRFVSPMRVIFLEKLAEIDPYHYQVYTLGKWGNLKVDDPYAMCFDEKKHVGITVLNNRYDVYLSFDFNVNPITCGVYQHYQGIKCIEAIQLAKSDIYKLCDYIRAAYRGCIFTVTGDATGQGTTALVQDGINYYTVIRSELKLAPTQLRVPTINPKVKENRVLVNAAFSQGTVTFDPIKAKGLIFDCKNVSVNEMGEIEKGDRKNPKKRADHLDHWRYYLNTFHKNILK
jgi:phage terminase large subunit